MLGERFILQDEYLSSGKELLDHLLPLIELHQGRFIVSLAGESGSGKTVLAHVASQLLTERGFNTLILSQDDYFLLPPISNDAYRRQHFDWVGPGEVNLARMDVHLAQILEGATRLTKPLIIYTDDVKMDETMTVAGVDIVIVEGTYVTLLDNVHVRVFFTSSYHQTKAERRARARDAQDEFVETVLEKEHRIISEHRARADFLISKDYHVLPANQPGDST